MRCRWVLYFLIKVILGYGQTALQADYQFIGAYQNEVIFTKGWAGDSTLETSSSVILFGNQFTCIRIRVPDLNFDTIFSIDAKVPVNISLPHNSAPAFPLEQAIHRSIRITSTFPIHVLYCSNYAVSKDTQDTLTSRSMEAQALIGTRNWGDNYAANHTTSEVISRTLGGEYNGFFSLVSAEDNNSIQFKLLIESYLINDSVVSLKKDSLYTITLNKGENYTLQALAENNVIFNKHMAGSTFIATKPFALYTTKLQNTCPSGIASVPSTHFLFEQQKKKSYNDTSFHIPPLKGWYRNQYSILAEKDSTVIKLNGNMLWVMDSLEHRDTGLTSPPCFQSNYPVNFYVSGCSSYFGVNNNPLSPFSLTASSDKELLTRSMFTTLLTDTVHRYMVGLVTKTSHTGLLSLDGQGISSSQFTPFSGDSLWSWANVEVDTGLHVLQGDSGFHAIHYTYTPLKTAYPDESYPAYGYNLPQSTPLPQDSFYFNIKPEQGSWQYFQDYDTLVCTGDLISFRPNSARFTNWRWHFGDGTDTLQRVDYTAAGIVNHSYSQPGLYWVVVEDSAGCLAGDSVLIEVRERPGVNFSHVAIEGCEGTWIQLNNQSQGATSYVWQLPEGETSTEENPGFFYESDGSITVALTVTNGICSSSKSESFIPQADNFNPEEIPNVFTPNGDGRNDCFTIQGLEGFTDCFGLTIYNRWGGEVFRTNDVNSCWDGGDLAEGVYFFTLTLGDKTYSGEVHLLR